VITYAGTCPLWTEFVAAGHVIAMARLALHDLCRSCGWIGRLECGRVPSGRLDRGTVRRRGPARSRRRRAGARAVWNFCVDFRGTPAQRTPDDFNIQEIAFDFQEFGTRQYYLAPAKGKFEGGQLVTDYPLAFLSSHGARGRFLQVHGRIAIHVTLEGFVFAGFFVKADALASDFDYDGSSRWRDRAEDCDNHPRCAGNRARGLFLDDPYSVFNLKVRLKSEAQFSSPGGVIKFEAAELLAYKPNWWDFYLLLRMSATKGGDIDQRRGRARARFRQRARYLGQIIRTSVAS
jgi:hypothetical protein